MDTAVSPLRYAAVAALPVGREPTHCLGISMPALARCSKYELWGLGLRVWGLGRNLASTSCGVRATLQQFHSKSQDIYHLLEFMRCGQGLIGHLLFSLPLSPLLSMPTTNVDNVIIYT
jgi:hypothetical protein